MSGCGGKCGGCSNKKPKVDEWNQPYHQFMKKGFMMVGGILRANTIFLAAILGVLIAQ